jgi:hypothetical protein
MANGKLRINCSTGTIASAEAIPTPLYAEIRGVEFLDLPNRILTSASNITILV